MGAPKHTVQVGQTFGLLEVIEVDLNLPPTKRKNRNTTVGERAVQVRCACGAEWIVKLTNLISPKTKQFACRSCAQGLKSGNDFESSIYYWLHTNIMRRCYDSKNHHYPNYGARGISVYSPWHDRATFEVNLKSEIGPRPAGKSLDRVDNSKNYEPGNLRWATPAEQSANRRPSSEWGR